MKATIRTAGPPGPARRFRPIEAASLYAPVLCAAVAAALGACAQAALVDAPSTPPTKAGDVRIFHAADAIQDRWIHFPIELETEYRLAHVGARLAIRAVGRKSASGLVRRVALDPWKCPILEWTWRVEKLQAKANLRVKDREDVAASIILMFGDPGMLTSPRLVPMIRYVWTNERLTRGTIVVNPHLPGAVRSIVVQSGKARLGHWVTERRDIVADFKKAFGRPPHDRIRAVALFTDNDHTHEPVIAYYGSARAICSIAAQASAARRGQGPDASS